MFAISQESFERHLALHVQTLIEYNRCKNVLSADLYRFAESLILLCRFVKPTKIYEYLCFPDSDISVLRSGHSPLL